jgi:hypothetical protein
MEFLTLKYSVKDAVIVDTSEFSMFSSIVGIISMTNVNFLIKLLIFAPNIFDPLRNTIGAKEYIFVIVNSVVKGKDWLMSTNLHLVTTIFLI